MLKIELSYRGLLVLGLALITLFALVQLWEIILLVITALIFMTALLPFVEWLMARGLPRVPAVLLIFAVIVLILAGILGAYS